MMRRVVVLTMVLALAAAAAPAQTISLINQSVSNITGTGARALGMGGAFIALADDATAASWNPAGLAQLSKPEVSLVYEDYSGSYDWDQVYEAVYTELAAKVENFLTLPGDFDSSGLTFASVTIPFKVGGGNLVAQGSYRRMASFPNFDRSGPNLWRVTDLGTQEIVDEFQTTLTDTDEWSGGFDSYTLSLGFPLGATLRGGVSVNYVDVSVDNVFRRTESFEQIECLTCRRLTGGYEFADWAFDVGLQWQPARPLTIGVVYHLGFEADFDYYESKEFAQYDWEAEAPQPREPTSSRGSTTVEWPSGWGAGLAWRATDTLTLTADYSEMSWSDAIVQEYQPAIWDENAQPAVGEPRDVYFPFAYEQKDSWTARAGAEFVIVLGNGALLPLRAGYFQERQFASLSPYYSQEPATFDGYSLGTGFAYKNIQFDIAWAHTEGDDSISESYQYEDVIIIGGEPRPVQVQAAEDNVFDFTSDRYLASIIIRF